MRSKSSLLAITAAMLAIRPMHMADDAPAAEPVSPAQDAPQPVVDEPVDLPAEPAQASEAVAPAATGIDVPVEHADLLQRAVDLLKSGEQWIVDNIEAGISTLENMLTPPDLPPQ